MTKWNTIESVPKDGTEILLAKFGADISEYELGFWSNNWKMATRAEDVCFEPTHWMLIPEQPDDIK